MTKQQKKQFDNLYNFHNEIDNIVEEEKEKNKKIKEREKRIKKRNLERKESFDSEIETVIGMTNKNKQKQEEERQRKITKKQVQADKKRKKIKRIIKLFTLLLFIVAGVIFALVSPIFNIVEINVINNEQVPQDTIISLSQLQVGKNIFKYNSRNVEKLIKEHSYVESVIIKRKIPNKIEIIIKERQKSYIIECLNGYAYINNQGYILETSEQKLDLPLIQGIDTQVEQILEGNRLNIDDLKKLEVIIQIMSICKNYELDSKISSIDMTDKDNYIIHMEEENKVIYLGDGSNLSNKMLYIPAILSENQGKKGIIYLNGDINNNFKPRFKLNVEI